MRGLLYMPNNNVKIFNITYLILSRYFVTEFSRISEKKSILKHRLSMQFVRTLRFFDYNYLLVTRSIAMERMPDINARCLIKWTSEGETRGRT